MKRRICRTGRKSEQAALLAAFALFAGLAAMPAALAQPVPGVNSGGVDASILQPRKLPTDQPDNGQPLKPKPEEKSKVDTGNAVPGTQTAVPDEGASPKFVLKEIQVSGVTVFPSKTLEEKFTPWIDREVGYNELLQLAADITKLYKDNGYITSRAILPPQEIENGIVTIQVVEGKLGDIKLEGNKHVPAAYIQDRLHLKPGEVFRLQSLQKDMLSLSSDPLLDKAHATLKTGTRPGTSDLVLDLDDHFPVHFMVGVDNGGRNGIGLWRTNYTLSDDNVSGIGDSLVMNAVLATHTLAAVGQYKLPLNTSGWDLGGNYSYSHVQAGQTQSDVLIGDTFKKRSITGDSHRFSLFSDFPIYKSPESRRWDVNGNLSLNFIDSMTFLDGFSLKGVETALRKLNPANTVEKFPSIRALTSQVQATEQDRTGRWLLMGSMTNAFNMLGGNESYTRFNSNISRIQAFPHGIIGLFRAEGQWTPDKLPFAEKMQLGGANSVRGYSEGDLIADYGYLLSAEFRYPLAFLPPQIRADWQGVAFVDYGQIFANGRHTANEGRPGSLLGYGIGFRGRVTKYLNARVDLGMATLRAGKQPDLRAHFSLSAPLF